MNVISPLQNIVLWTIRPHFISVALHKKKLGKKTERNKAIFNIVTLYACNNILRFRNKVVYKLVFDVILL